MRCAVNSHFMIRRSPHQDLFKIEFLSGIIIDTTIGTCYTKFYEREGSHEICRLCR